MKDLETNDVFWRLEASKLYRETRKTVEKVLNEQWEDFIFSGAVNKVFKRYLNFFSNKEDKTLNLKKAEGTTVEDVEEEVAENLQADKFLVGEDGLDLDAFEIFLLALIAKELKSAGRYYSLRGKLRDYIKTISNKGGQSIIDQLPTALELKFRLSNATYKQRIAERVDNLIVGLDQTTKNKISKVIIAGVKKRETRTQLIRRLTRMGKKISKSRAKMIVATETQAAYEFMRYETAKKNGIQYKVWNTARDERVCPICGPLHGKRLAIDKDYSSVDEKSGAGFGGLFPPAHVNCRCSLDYEIQPILASNWVLEVDKFKSSISLIANLFRKLTNGTIYDHQSNVIEELAEDDVKRKVINVNAVWAGGESLVGKDKNIGNIYYDIIAYDNYRERVKELIRTQDKIMIIDQDDFFPTQAVDLVLLDARENLTDEGFVQLIRILGFSRSIPKK